MTKRRGRKSTKPVSQGLAQAIKESGLSPYKIAMQAGINPSIITRFLNGERGISLATADRIAAVLGLELRRIPQDPPARTTERQRQGR